MTTAQPATIDQDAAVTALRAVWAALGVLGGQLTDEQWGQPSILPGWSVGDVYAHVLGTERFLEGDSAPRSDVDVKSLAHVKNPIGKANEYWVLAYRDKSRGEVLDDFADVTRTRLEKLTDMPAEEFNKVGYTPVGEDAYGRFIRLRILDSVAHELDIRDGLRLPAPELSAADALAFDEITATLPFLIGKRAAPAPGTITRLVVTGPGARTLTFVTGDSRTLISDSSATPTVTLTIDGWELLRVFGRRASANPAAFTVDGDRDLAARIIDALPATV